MVVATTLDVERTVADEAADYATAVRGVDLDVVRTGQGVGPNIITAVTGQAIALVSGFVQFPVLGQTALTEDAVGVTMIVGTRHRGRWSGIDIQPGTMMLYGPGAEHTAQSPVGLEYRFLVTEWHNVEEIAEQMSIRISPPKPGSVTTIGNTIDVGLLRSVLHGLGNPLLSANAPALDSETALHAMVSTMHDMRDETGRDRIRRIGNRAIVTSAVDYATATDRIPSIAELCVAAHTSERRLRTAFTDSFGMPPTAYFRNRFLSRARGELLTGDGRSVTGVALDLGFRHLGRFSVEYAKAFGESPSATTARGGPGRPGSADGSHLAETLNLE